MKKINITGCDETLYLETLENGLEIYLLPYEDKNNYFISYATKYGSDILKFKLGSEEYTPPLGIAHYLEHKMFEEESGEDPFTFFSCSGTDANASTSYDSTQYICYGTKKFKDNLRYLIQFVNNPYFTNENVEKEKGIIAEEIKMYQDYPDYKLEMKLRSNLYRKSPRKYDIAGTIKEIDKITKEDLYKCYNAFYLPNNMFILIVGNFKVEEALSVIKSELNDAASYVLPKIIRDEEPLEVVRRKNTMYEYIEVPKIAMGIKIPKNVFKVTGVEQDLYLNMLTTILFGSSSEFRERVRNDKILNDIYMEWEDLEDYHTFYLMATSTDPDRLLEEIQYELDNASVAKNAFERIKKVWIANEVKMMDHIERMEANLYDDIIRYGKVIPNRIEYIRKMSLATMNEFVHSIDFDNKSIIKMMPKEKKEDIRDE